MSSNSVTQLSDENDFNLYLGKLLANPRELEVYDHPEWIRPNIGSKVEIISWDTQCNVRECVKAGKLSYLTVKEINPIVVGYGDRYYWSYGITVNEVDLEFLQWHYKIL